MELLWHEVNPVAFEDELIPSHFVGESDEEFGSQSRERKESNFILDRRL